MTTNPLFVASACCPACGANVRNGDHDSQIKDCPMCAPQPDQTPDVELP